MSTEPEKIKTFKDLNVWKEGHKLVLMIYRITKIFPKEELFSLTSQMRRASVSITSNIAEGFSRQSYKDKANFYTMSLGSLTETENQIIIAKDLGYIREIEFNEVYNQMVVVSKLCNGIIKKSRSIHDS